MDRHGCPRSQYGECHGGIRYVPYCLFQTLVMIVWCTGTLVLFTGILPICEDEAGVAAVLAHGMWAEEICRSCSLLNDSVEIGHVGQNTVFPFKSSALILSIFSLSCSP